jgi:DHA3 family macrolide efflux protein-like MFS transporter
MWTGQAFSLLGSQLVQFALVWWLTKTTGSATVLALASLAALLPQLLLGPLAGVLVDRWSRKAILIAADTGVALATLGLALFFWLNMAAVWTIYGLLLIRAVGAAFHWPAMQATTTLMVPEKHLSRIGGLNQTLLGLAGIFIPPLGALAVELLPMQGVLAIDVVTAIPAVGTLLFIAIPQPTQPAGPAGTKSSLWVDMRAGLHFLLNWKALMALSAIGIAINMLGRAAGSLTPILIIRHFNGGAFELGWWQSAVGIGTMTGGVILGVWGGLRRRVVTQLLVLTLDGLAIVAIGLTPGGMFLFAVVIVFCAGILEAIVLGLSGAVFQTIIPPEMQGRMFSLLISISQGLAPLGLLVAGPAADAFGIQFWWLLTGAMIVTMGAGGLLVPSIVHIEDRSYRSLQVA